MQDVPRDNEDADPFMTIGEVARFLRIPKATLYTWRTRRPGYGPPGFKVNGMLRYRRSEVVAWAENFREPSPAPTPYPSPRLPPAGPTSRSSRLRRPRPPQA